jgi:hypothetical protein
MVSQKVTWKWDSVYEKKKEKKSRVSSNWAKIDTNIPAVSSIQATPKKRQQK